ncbi:hypothetical protein K435DRAFT_878384 [Dendrothele bispora CBS 962.96]|uniref:NADP-dependent oxidoreductase domain-containing protein n=1 Tax=Dendrothele bispora (strain CBS 962.96) TaxID=1314807 RepID=A0A4S8KMZ8_DENBC|nr:hypothetical protein K435DRAFT_878384 [Dendrothele bispora CBS 962.96]
MPWDLVKLNSGYEMPTIAFGTWKMGNGDGPISQVDQAINVGFSHVGVSLSISHGFRFELKCLCQILLRHTRTKRRPGKPFTTVD